MESAEINGNHNKSTEIHGNQKKSMESLEIRRNTWNPKKSYEIHGIDGNQRKSIESTEINGNS